MSFKPLKQTSFGYRQPMKNISNGKIAMWVTSQDLIAPCAKNFTISKRVMSKWLISNSGSFMILKITCHSAREFQNTFKMPHFLTKCGTLQCPMKNRVVITVLLKLMHVTFIKEVTTWFDSSSANYLPIHSTAVSVCKIRTRIKIAKVI